MAEHISWTDITNEMSAYEAQREKLDEEIRDFNAKWAGATHIQAEARTQLSTLVQANDDMAKWAAAILHKSRTCLEGGEPPMDDETCETLRS